MTAAPYMANATPLRDVSTHTYRTDPRTMFLITLGEAKPVIRAYTAWVVNLTDQSVQVQIIANVVNDQSQPDVNVGSPATVAAGGAAIPYTQYFPAGAFEFLGVALTAATAPTKGAVTSRLYIYYGE